MRNVRLFFITCAASLFLASTALSVDLNEGFESTFPPPGWQNFQAGDGLQTWYQTDVADNGGIYGIRSEEEVIAVEDTSKLWLILPPVVVDNVADQIVFWARNRFTVTDDDTLFLRVSTTDDLPASFTQVAGAWTAGIDLSTSWAQFSADLGNWVNDTIYVAFVHVNPGADDGGFDAMDIYLDDITGPEILAPPYASSDPTPPNGETGTDPATNLGWTNNGAVTLDLYLALSQDSVDNEIPEARKLTGVLATSYDPPSDLEEIATYYWKVVSHNAYGSTDSPVWTFTTAGTPLAGTYDIGGATPDFASFAEAIGALQAAGISAPVTFDVYGGDYDEWVLITGPIVGTSATDTILFRDASGTARIVHGADIGVSVGALQLDSCGFMIFDGIDVDVSGGDTRKCIGMRDGTHDCIIRNATLTGNGFVSSISYCFYMYSNDVKNNILEELHVTNARIAFNISAFTGDDDHSEGNIFRNNVIDNVWNGFVVSYAKTIFIHDNDIQLNGAGNSSTAYGFVRDSGTSIDTVSFYNNKVHNIVTSSSSGAGLANVDGGLTGGVVRVYNNFCYDFDAGIGGVRVFYLEDANGEIFNNSIHVNDVSGGTIYFNYMSGSNNNSIKNNIFYNGDPDNTARGLYGSLTTYAPAEMDYNVWYYTSPNWLTHYMGSSQQYATLADMQANTAYGDNSVEGDPGFTSATDLHIQNTIGTVSNLGQSIAYITDDIDGDGRSATPDIGADEYLFLAPPADYRVVSILNPLALYPELAAVTIDVIVLNNGSAAQTDVPVRLFYGGTQEDEVLVSLAPEAVDTIQFTWNTPAAPSAGDLEAQAFLTGDANSSNDSVFFATAILGQDYAVLEILDPLPAYPDNSVVTIQARIQNQGSADQTDIPVRLYYLDAQQDEELVSLTVNEIDTVDFIWNTGAAPTAGNLEVQAFQPTDQDDTDDSLFFATQVVGSPLAGIYSIGAAGDYTTFAAAVNDLVLRGISAAVVFQVEAETFVEAIAITTVPGASAVNTVTFEPAPGALDTPPELIGNAPVVSLNGVSYLTWDGIDVTATSTGAAFYAENACSNITVENCLVVGGAASGSSNYGIRFVGADSDNNLIDNVEVTDAYYGIRFEGTSATGGNVANEIRNSHVVCKYGIWVSYQDAMLIHNNNVEPRYNTGTAAGVYGIYISSQSAGDVVSVYNNEIHGIVSTSTSYGVYVSTGSGVGLGRVYNNFLYDFAGLTGTSAAYGIYVASGGVAEVSFNSLWMNPSSTGIIAGLYSTGTTNSSTVRNNIFYFDVPTEDCYGIYQATTTTNPVLDTDYNLFYNTGTGLVVGHWGTGNDYATLALWQAEGYDLNSIEGDPGYVGGTNLHIVPTIDVVDGMGTTIAGITEDFDGDTRAGTPDIGADEYDVTTLPADYKVNAFIGLLERYNAGATVTISVEIENTGSANQTDAPVRLFYEGAQEDEVLVSLTAGQIDTIDFSWTTPVTLVETGVLEAQAFLAGDGFALNDSVTATVLITTPMSGIYDLGGGLNHYSTFFAAIADLTSRGIEGEVIIDAYDGSYVEGVTVTPILGTNFVDRVIFRAHPGDDVEIYSNINLAAVTINNADFITFDGIDIRFDGDTDYGFEILGSSVEGGADYVSIQNLSILGWGANGNTTTHGVTLHMDGNDNFLMDNVVVDGVAYGIRCETGSTVNDAPEIRNCTFNDANYSVYLQSTSNALVHDNDIRPQSTNTTAIYGVYLSLTGNTDTRVYNNRIHDIRYSGTSTSAAVVGIQAGGTNTLIYNNFIYGFDATSGTTDIAAIRPTTNAVAYAYHNSIHIPAGQAADEKVGIRISIGTLTAINNTIVIEEQTGVSYGIYRSGTSAVLAASDYNNIYSPDAEFITGRDDVNSYASLNDWSLGTGFDVNSVAGDPGYVSASDLHISPAFSLLDGEGLALAEVTTDIDGDLRDTPPDIGADEYTSELPAPTELTIYPDIVEDDIIVRWEAVVGANSYNVYVGDTEDFDINIVAPIGMTGGSSFTHVDALLSPDALKFYKVTASVDPPAIRADRTPRNSR